MYSNTRTTDRLLEIEGQARSLQIDIYKRRVTIWNGNPPEDPVDILEPGVALRHSGYSVRSVSAIGELEVGGVRSEVAGLIDHGRKMVEISNRNLNQSQRYTTAHELGHAILHPNGPIMHRDLPLERAGVVRDWREVEANRFASAYLMPRKLLQQCFGDCFELDEFELNDATAYALCGADADTVQRKYRGLRPLSQHLAGTGRFNGRYFRPLSEQFKVSPFAMAIRLEELELVKAA